MTSGSRLHQALEYSTPVGYRPLELDLYLPDRTSAAAAPLIIVIHGGGWRVGSRRSFGPAFADWSPSPFERLTEAGFAVASLDYRLSAEAIFPAQLDDVRAAAQWLAAAADSFGLDPQRTVVWGESAGGHLAALLGLTGPSAGAENTFRVLGVVDWYGPADLRTMQRQSRADAVTSPDAPDSRESLLIGATLGDSPELADTASPVTYVHPGAPEFHIAHGSADRFVPVGQSEQLADTLTAAGVAVELRIVEGADHMWRGTSEVPDIFATALAFAQRVVGRPVS